MKGLSLKHWNRLKKKMYSEILSRTRTVDELRELEHEIDIVAKSEYKADGGLAHVLNTSVRNFVAQNILAGSQSIGIDPYLQGLRSALSELEPLQITLAFEPTDAIITRFYDWVLNNVSGGIVLDIIYDPWIIAGVKVVYKGKYGDYSIASNVE